MPYDSNGNYTLPGTYFVENGDTVLPIQHNPPLEDIQTALSSVLLRSGVAPMTGDLNMGTKKITGVGAGTSTTDAVTKGQLDLQSVKYATKAGNYTLVANDNDAIVRFTGPATAALTAAATLGANWHCTVVADGGDVVIDPDASETINGDGVLIVPSGSSAFVICSGSAFFTTKDEAAGLFDFFMGCVQAWVSNISISFSSGIGFFGGKKHVLPTYTKTMSSFAAGNNAGMLDTGTIQASKTYFLHAIRNIATGDCDYLASLSLTPTPPAGWERLSGSRVGCVLTTSGGVIVQFVQEGNRVLTPYGTGFAATSSPVQVSPPALTTIPSIPLGLQVDALVDVLLQVSNSGGTANVTAGAGAAVAAGGSSGASVQVLTHGATSTDGINASETGGQPVRSNTSAQISRYLSGTGSYSATWYCGGWIDFSCRRLWA